MKRCPTCQRTYPDDAPDFCTADGTHLVKVEAEGYDPLKTMMASQPPPPPPQYANPAPPPPGMPQSAPPPPQGWPPPPPPAPQQGQNWAGGYYPAQQGYAPPAAQSNVLSLIALILGVLSAVLAALPLLEEREIMRTVGGPNSETTFAVTLGAGITGIAAIIVGIIALILKRQRGKLLAIIGMVLAAFGIIVCIYLEAEYSIIF